MKKNVLALSIATAVVGFAGSAHAITNIGTAATATPTEAATTAATEVATTAATEVATATEAAAVGVAGAPGGQPGLALTLEAAMQPGQEGQRGRR